MDEVIYMSLPQGYHITDIKKACKLRKSIYGLKQASRQWNHKFSHVMNLAGFRQSQFDHSLFINNGVRGITLLIVYVDDMIITGNNTQGIADLKTFLHSHLQIRDLGALRYFLGIEIARSKEGLTCLKENIHLNSLLKWVLLVQSLLIHQWNKIKN